MDGTALLDSIADTFERYVVLPDGAQETLALFVLHTYGFDTCDISPILAITSPVKQCGKTRTQDLLEALVYRPLRASNATSAVIFRVIEGSMPTLLLDETDSYMKQNEQMRGILDSGHTKAAAFVLRNENVGDSWEPMRFSTWCPKILAGIGRLPSTVEDRAIIIPMKRKQAHEQVERMRPSRLHGQLKPLRQRAVRWVADVRKRLDNADPSPIEGFSDRANDNWSPLLAIADAAGGDWPQRARQAARALRAFADDFNDDAGLQLLADIRAIFSAAPRACRLGTEAILTDLNGREDRPWAEFSRGWPLTPSGLAKLLRPFEIKPNKHRNGSATFRGYSRADFEDAWTRYLGDALAKPLATGTNGTRKPSDSERVPLVPI